MPAVADLHLYDGDNCVIGGPAASTAPGSQCESPQSRGDLGQQEMAGRNSAL